MTSGVGGRESAPHHQQHQESPKTNKQTKRKQKGCKFNG